MATLSKGQTFASGDTVTATKLNNLVDAATISGIVDADVSASAAIADTKLATISTAGKVANSATTATSANTASAIVTRDASGNFSAGTITASITGSVTGNVSGSSGSCTGNAATATKLSSARTFALTGDVTGSTSSDLTSGSSIAATIANTSVTSGKLADAAVTGAAGGGKLAASSINSQTVLSGSIDGSDEFLIYDASAAALRKVTWSSLQPSGTVLQTKYAEADSSSTTNAAISYSAGGPPSTSYSSGVSVLSTTITPQSTTNRLIVKAVLAGIDSTNAGVVITGFLVGGSTLLMSNAIDIYNSYTQVGTMTLMGSYVPASISSQTIAVYIGGAAAGTHTTGKISLLIQEIKA